MSASEPAKPAPKAPPPDPQDELRHEKDEQQRRLQGMLRIAKSLNTSRDPRAAMQEMVEEISLLLHADRTTIYELQDGVLKGLAVQGDPHTQISLPLNQGIAGLVAYSKRPINVKDAYLHPAFNPLFDQLNGYRTRSVLCVPMLDQNQQVLGVVQAMNKENGGYFTPDDEMLLCTLAMQAAITLKALELQLRLYQNNLELDEQKQQLSQRVQELAFLGPNEQALAEASSTEEIAQSLLPHLAELAQCNETALLIAGPEDEKTIYFQEIGLDRPLRILRRQKSDHILMQSFLQQSGFLFDCPDDFDKQGISLDLGFNVTLRTAVTLPIFEGDQCLGAIGFFNFKKANSRDLGENHRFVELIAAQLGRAIARVNRQITAQQRDRMMTIGQMMSSVMHDLRGPLANISLYAQMLQEPTDPDEQKLISDTIVRQVQHITSMANEVLTFAQGKSDILIGKVRPEQFMQAVHEQLENEFRAHHIELRLNLISHEPVWFDQNKILRAVTNIARNARQALNDHGCFTLTFNTGHCDFGGESHPCCIITCSDDGPGVPEQIREHLFDAFTTAGKEGGTGLGLAIAKRMIEEHQGRIRCETETGKGTSFIIEIPQDGR